MFLDVAHGFADGGADHFLVLAAFGPGEEFGVAGVGREVKHAFGVVGGGFVEARTSSGRVALPTTGRLFFEDGAAFGEANIGKAEEDEPQNRSGILGGGEAGIGAELVSGFPQAFFESVGGGVFFRWSDPLHSGKTKH